MRIARLCLRVQNFTKLSDFYCNLLGMHPFDGAPTPLLGYKATECLLELQEGNYAPLKQQDNHFYWKIGITLPHLDKAIAYLQAHEYPVSKPKQFRDIGYMSHLHDPEGFTIELLQQSFKGHEKPITNDQHPIGGQATLAHITLRITDLETAKAFCEQELQMRLISVQPVSDLGFTLYFYTGSNEHPPTPNLKAPENREWLWARPYTLLELQHLETKDMAIIKPDQTTTGFESVAIAKQNSKDLTYLTLDNMKALH